MPQIADTGFLVAYWNKADIHHAWARSLAVRAPLLTCEPVITEAAYLIGNPEPLLQMLMDRGQRGPDKLCCVPPLSLLISRAAKETARMKHLITIR